MFHVGARRWPDSVQALCLPSKLPVVTVDSLEKSTKSRATWPVAVS